MAAAEPVAHPNAVLDPYRARLHGEVPCRQERCVASAFRVVAYNSRISIIRARTDDVRRNAISSAVSC